MQPVWQTLRQRNKATFSYQCPLSFCHVRLQLAVSFTCPPWFLHDDIWLEVYYICALLRVLMSHNHCTRWLYVDVQKAQRVIGSCRRILEVVEIGLKGSGVIPNMCLLCISFHRRLEWSLCVSLGGCLPLLLGETALFNASEAVC